MNVGNVSVTSDSDVVGVSAAAGSGVQTNATAGDVKATSDSAKADGVQAKANEGTVTVATGSVTAEGASDVSGINSQAGTTKRVEDENGEWTYKATEGTSTVTAAGDVKAAAAGGTS